MKNTKTSIIEKTAEAIIQKYERTKGYTLGRDRDILKVSIIDAIASLASPEILSAYEKSLLNIKGDNLCWLDEMTKIPPAPEFLESCKRFHAQVSLDIGVLEGCKTIAQLEKENLALRKAIKYCMLVSVGAQEILKLEGLEVE